MKKLCIVLAAIVLTGCGKTVMLSDESEALHRDDTANVVNNTELTSDVPVSAETEVTYIEPSPPSEEHRIGIIDSDGDEDIREELTRYLNEHGGISEDEEIYYPKLTIEGFTLYRTVIDEWSFMYYYAPTDKLSEDYVFEFNDGILLGYDRTHWIDTSDPLGSELRKYEIQQHKYTYKDGLLKPDNSSQIKGVVKNTRFTLIVTDEMDDDELLFEMGKAIIDSTEVFKYKCSR